MKRGITIPAIILHEARRTSSALVGLLLAALLSGGGSVVLSAGATPGSVAGGVVLLAGWLALGAWLLRDQRQIRAVLHATGVPGKRVLSLFLGRMLTFTLPGAAVGAIIAFEARLPAGAPVVTVVPMALAGFLLPLLILVVMTGIAFALSSARSEGTS